MKFSHFIENLFGDRAKIRVYRVLTRHSEGMTGRAIACLIDVSPFKINQVLRELVEEGIVEAASVGKANLYRLNRRHVLTRDLVGFLVAYEDGFLKKFGEEIMQRLDPKPLSVILYGSIARGEEGPKSDLDLCLVYADDDPLPGPLTEAGSPLSEWVGRTYGNPVSVIRSLLSDFKQRAQTRDPLMRNVIKEGRVIAGLSITEILDYGRKKTQHGRSPQKRV